MNSFEYTNENYEEDRKIVYFCVNKFLRLYPMLEHQRDDIISNILYFVYNLHKTFDSSRGVKFMSYASKNIYFMCLSYLKKYIKDRNNISLSIDETFGDDNDLSFLDLVPVNFDFLSNLRYFELLDIIKIVFTKFSESHINVLKYWLKNFDINKTAEFFNLSRQTVSYVINDFRYYLKNELLKNNFVENSFFEKEYKLFFSHSLNLSYYVNKYGLSHRTVSRLKKQYDEEKTKISFEDFLKKYCQKREELKNLTKYDYNKRYMNNQRKNKKCKFLK